MTTMQLDMDFTSPAPAEDVARLVGWLRTHPGFHTARKLMVALDFPTDRAVRKAAEQSEGEIVSGPGCPGYAHYRNCTADELNTVANRLESQARHMQQRGIAIRRRAHAVIG